LQVTQDVFGGFNLRAFAFNKQIQVTADIVVNRPEMFPHTHVDINDYLPKNSHFLMKWELTYKNGLFRPWVQLGQSLLGP
jgi:hypothetical protein